MGPFAVKTHEVCAEEGHYCQEQGKQSKLFTAKEDVSE